MNINKKKLGKDEISKKYKRVNILITEGQHALVQENELSLSGLVRDLLDDRFSNKKIVLSLSPKTREIYDKLISNFGASDAELEKYFVQSMGEFLKEKANELEELRDEIAGK